MNASAILARIQDAGVTVRAEHGSLKLKGPKAALSKTIVSELLRLKPELLKLLGNEQLASPRPDCVAAWRVQIESLPPLSIASVSEARAAYRMEQLRYAALSFLDGVWARRAVEAGWNAVQLFGINPAAPELRFGAWGLVVFLAWSVHEQQVVDIGGAHATFRTTSGAELRKPRELAEAGNARPFWEMFACASRRQGTTLAGIDAHSGTQSEQKQNI